MFRTSLLTALAVCPFVSAAAVAAPLNGPDGVCDPQEELLGHCFVSPNGFVVEIVPDGTGAFPAIDAQGNSVFSYLVTGAGSMGGSCAGTNDVSHVSLLLPVCPDNPLEILGSMPAGRELPGGDPSCGFGAGDPTTDVFKWDVGADCNGSALYTLVLQGAIDAAPTSMLLKEGPDCNVATILGPACTVPCEGTLGDFVWIDLDGDGMQDPGEPGMGGVTLRLLDANAQVVGETQTGPDGSYSFDQLCPGTYTVEVDGMTLLEGVVPSPCAMGNDAGIDSNCDPATTTLTDLASADMSLDFGYEAPPYVYCESPPNSTGAPAGINADGNPSISENDFFVTVTGLPPNQPGWFFYGTEEVDLPFGNGTRCIGGQVSRYRKLAIEITGDADVQLDFTIPPLTQIVPGVPYYFQLWFRDPQSGGANFSTSDAMRVIFAP